MKSIMVILLIKRKQNIKYKTETHTYVHRVAFLKQIKKYKKRLARPREGKKNKF